MQECCLLEMTAAPVTRLTPHLHDISITSLTSTAMKSAGTIVVLAEALITGVMLKKVSVEALRCLTIAYASALTEHADVRD